MLGSVVDALDIHFDEPKLLDDLLIPGDILLQLGDPGLQVVDDLIVLGHRLSPPFLAIKK